MSAENSAYFILYVVLSYWAAGKLVYRHSIRFGAPHVLFFQQLVIGALFGWLLIPIAVLMVFLNL